jgi:hypothetical protein
MQASLPGGFFYALSDSMRSGTAPFSFFFRYYFYYRKQRGPFCMF